MGKINMGLLSENVGRYLNEDATLLPRTVGRWILIFTYIFINECGDFIMYKHERGSYENVK